MLITTLLVVFLMPPVPAAADDPPGLAATSWRFVDVTDVASLPDAQPTLEFGADGAVAGFAGCNRYFGSYTQAAADQLTFSQVGSTKMWCGSDVMPVEIAVLSAIDRTNRFLLGPGRLDLLDRDGAVLARLVPLTSGPGLLSYEIVVTDPGSRSQGWRGVLYDSIGEPVVAAPGTTVSAPTGQFVNVACDAPWTPCGMIRTDMADWMKTHQVNGVFDDVPWSYRLYVANAGTPDERWTGILRHGTQEVAPADAPVDTPMGPFRSVSPTSTGPARSGWFPAGWQ